jgi:hypothetical protein
MQKLEESVERGLREESGIKRRACRDWQLINISLKTQYLIYIIVLNHNR